MKPSWKSLISLLLVLVFVFQLFPASVLAVEAEDEVSTNEEQISDIGSVDEEESADSAEANNTFVVGEVDGLREESVKHFRMSDGSFTLVEYDTPIHFQSQDGKWEDIDNTLQKRGDQFVTENGDMTKKFSSDLSNGDILSLQYKGYSLNMSLVTALNAESEPQEIDVTPNPDTTSDETSNEQDNDEMTAESEESVEPNQNKQQQEVAESNVDKDAPSDATPEDGYTAPSESSEMEDNTDNENELKEVVEYEKIKAADIKATVKNPEEVKKISGKTSLAEMIDPEKTRSEIKYCQALNDADLLYQNKGYNIKESIIINAPQDSYEYSFGLNLEGLIPELQENGAVYLKGENGDIVFEIPAPYMVDSNLIRSDAAKYMLSETKNCWVLTVVADTEWLNDNERAFPVTLDPTLYLHNTSNIQATYICSAKKYYNGGNADIYVGYASDSSHQMCQICAKINTLPTIPANCTPTSAHVAFFHISYFTSTNFGGSSPSTGDLVVEAHSTKDFFNSISSVTWDSVYTYGNGIESTVLDYQRLNNATRLSNEYNFWDITPVAMGWFSNNSIGSEIMLTAPNAETEQRIANLWSESGPYFVVSYRNTVGLEEDYYTYQEASAGRAGSIYISDFTQQLTAVRTDLVFPSEVTPFTLSHVYNSDLCSQQFTGGSGDTIHSCNYSYMKLGYGWKLSAMQTVVPITINNKQYLIYNDADGTEHYFQKTGTYKYEDEDGLRLTITKSTSGSNTIYTMTDYGAENTWTFHNGYLISQADSAGNKIYYAYRQNYNSNNSNWKPLAGSNAENRLVQIVSAPKNQSTREICSFNYDQDKLISITDYAQRTIAFTYTSENSALHLSSIKDTDAGVNQVSAQYLYDNNTGRLSTLYDVEAKYGLDITQRWVLGRWATNRVSEFTSSSVSGSRAFGNAFHAYRNSNQLTSYRFYGPDHVADDSPSNPSTDDIISYYVLDYSGRTICAYDTNYNKQSLVGATSASYTENNSTSKKNNRLTGAAVMGRHSTNLMRDLSAEAPSYWTGSSSVCSQIDSPIARTGNGMLKCTLDANASDTATAYVRQMIRLEAGHEYIFSGYVNTSGITSFPNENTGAYLAVYRDNSQIGKSELINIDTAPSVDPEIDPLDSGWQKVSAYFTALSTGPYYFSFELYGAKGSCYCDDMQLEQYDNVASSDKAPSPTNIIKNSGFEDNSAIDPLYCWTNQNDFSLYYTLNPLQGEYCAGTVGNPGNEQHLKQTINVNKPAAGLTFVLSGWGKANSVGSAKTEPDGNAPYFGLIAEINYSNSNNNPERHYVSFNSDYIGWQFASGIVVPKQTAPDKIISTIDIYCAYDYNANQAYFDNVSLLREPLETYYYDDDGNLQSSANGNAEINCTYVSNSNRLQTYKTPSGITHSFTYDSYKLLKTESFAGVTKTNTRSSVGKVTQEKTTATGTNQYLQQNWSFYNCFTNADDSQFCTASTDVNGLTTNYLYFENYNNSNLPTRQLDFIRKPNGTEQHYTYYSNSDRTYQTYISGVSSVKYYYGEDNNTGNCSNEMLSSIRRKSFYTTEAGTTEFHQKYSIGYNDLFGNVASISVSGSNTGMDNSYSAEKKLIQKSYESNINNGRLATMTYPNGDAVSFGYDLFDRITSETYTTTNGSNMTIHNEYSSEGDLVKKYSQDQQGVTAEAYVYNYDSLGRLIHSREYNNGSVKQQTSNYYDKSDRPKQQSWICGNAAFTQDYSYNIANDTLANISYAMKAAGKPFSTNTSFSYDKLLRPIGKTTTYESVSSGTTTINYQCTYRDVPDSSRTTAQVETMNYYKNSDNTPIIGTKYEYDQAGNLYKVYPYNNNTNNYSQAAYQTYSYDEMGQLKSVDDFGAGCYYYYTYDTAGNIRKIIKSPYTNTATTIELFYNDSIWADRLSSVKVGNTTGNIVYENAGTGFISGNPISYYNGRNYSFSWQNGRQLSTTTVGNTSVSYSYDMSGLRSSKTVGSTTYSFDTLNGRVTRQKWDTDTLWFVYDNEDKPYALIYQSGPNDEPSIYFYALNLQGDVVALLYSSGSIAAKYRYDPWGAVTVQNSNGSSNSDPTFIGNINPLRYRGYYYDSETGLYYLQSRYYDPAIGRFINADTFATTDADGFLSCNMFAYCENNPISREDSTGEFFLETALVGAFVGSLWGICNGVISAAISGEDIAVAALEGAATGAITGAAAATTGSIFLAAGIAALACSVVDAGIQWVDKGKVNLGKSAAIGLQSGVDTIIGKGASKLLKDIAIKASFTAHAVVQSTKNLLSTTAGVITNYLFKANCATSSSTSGRYRCGNNSYRQAIK